jgi:hypothetical protein
MSGGSDQASRASQQAAGAVLRFNGEGINRILFVADIYAYLAFTGQAKAQAYFPTYAFPDYQAISGVAAYYGTAQDNAGSIAVSTSPAFVPDDDSRRSSDLTSDYDRSKLSPGRRRCYDLLTTLMKKDYYKPGSSGSSKYEVYFCEHFFSWLDAARTLGAAWTPERHGEAIRRLGTGYAPVLNNSVDWSGGRSDGASTYRVGRYDADCACFVRLAPWRPLP